jgi:hypothetical protein
MNPFTAQTPTYPPEIQELLAAIAEAKSDRVRNALIADYNLWQSADSMAKQKEAERKARMLASGATPEEIADLLKDSAGAAQKLAVYLGGVAHSAQIRNDFPPYWMVTVVVGEKITTLGASETVRAMLQTNKSQADRWLASFISAAGTIGAPGSATDWTPPTQSLVEAFFGA